MRRVFSSPLLGWLFAIGVLGAALWLYDNATDLDAFHQQQAEAKANAYADRARIAIQRNCSQLSAEDQIACVEEAQEAARKGQHDEYDLEAQIVTSIWTRHMGIAALFGTAFGMIGVALVLATFRENKRAADAAEQSLSVTRELFQIETRPILIPDKMVFEKVTDEYWQCAFTWKNVGKLPAVIVAGRSAKYHAGTEGYEEALTKRLEAPVEDWERELPDTATIPSGGVHQSRVITFEIGDVKAGDITWAYAKVEYRSALAKEAQPWHTEHLGAFFPSVDFGAAKDIIISNAPATHPEAKAITGMRFDTVVGGVKMT